MLSKSFTASILLLALTSSVTAQCAISPALGVTGTPGTSDVQHPSESAPCGSIPIGQNIDSATTIPANENGLFEPTITNFNTGVNGSRSIQSARVDASGTGASFAACQIVTNGDADPSSQGTQQLGVKLPDGIKCAGGTNKDRCLVSIITDGGDGNCVVVTQADTTENSPTSKDGAKGPTSTQNGAQTNGHQSGAQSNANQGTSSGADKANKQRMIRKRRL
ncbi:hypothetical protein V8E52_000751 [Russula decolorans]